VCERRLWKYASHCTGVLSGELLYLGLLEAGKKMLWKQSISMEAL